MELSIILDAALCVILIAAFCAGLKRGLLKTLWGLIALVLTIVLAAVLRPCVSESFKSSAIGAALRGYVYSAVEENACGLIAPSGESREIYALPDKYGIALPELAEGSVSAAADAAAEVVTEIASVVFLVIIIRLALWIIHMILKFASALPVLKETNRIAGALAQLVIAAAAVYAALAAAAVVGTDIFDDTIICKFMYDRNLLLAVMGL